MLSSFLQITLAGGLTDEVGVIGKIGDELCPIAASPLFAFDVVLLLFVLEFWCVNWLLFDDALAEPWACFNDDDAVVLFADAPDDIPELDVFVLLLVIVLLLLEPPRDDGNVDDEHDERPADFELFAFDDCWCVCCWRTFALRFLNQTCLREDEMKKKKCENIESFDFNIFELKCFCGKG